MTRRQVLCNTRNVRPHICPRSLDSIDDQAHHATVATLPVDPFLRRSVDDILGLLSDAVDGLSTRHPEERRLLGEIEGLTIDLVLAIREELRVSPGREW